MNILYKVISSVVDADGIRFREEVPSSKGDLEAPRGAGRSPRRSPRPSRLSLAERYVDSLKHKRAVLATNKVRQLYPLRMVKPVAAAWHALCNYDETYRNILPSEFIVFLLMLSAA